MVNLNTTYLGLNLKSPLLIGSSGLTNSVQDIALLEEYGAGAVVLKSIFEEEIIAGMVKLSGKAKSSSGNADPLAFDYNYYEIKDQKLDAYLQLIDQAKKQVKIPIIASINCVSDHEWPYFAQRMEEAGADAIELNVFASPMDFSKASSENEKLYFDLIDEINKCIQIPVAMKIGPYSANLGPFIQRLSETKLEGIVLFNRFWNLDFDIENFKVLSSYMFSNAEEYSQILRWIAIMSQRVSCDLSASTGVHDGETFIKLLLAGATTVQVVSALYKRDKAYLKEFLNELEFWMDRHGFTSIDDFRGKLSQSSSDDPAMYERVQFMKNTLEQA